MTQESGPGPRPAWFVGATFGNDDQTARFLAEGIWEHGFQTNKRGIRTHVREMQPGDRIAIKSIFTRKEDHPFDTHGRHVSMMRIKATGTITNNPSDGNRVLVQWDPIVEPPREWRFYTHMPTLWKVDPEQYVPERRWLPEALIAFTFDGAEQDIPRFLRWPYWRDIYQPPDATPALYTTQNIVDEGCFLDEDHLQRLLTRLRDKKNLILQGPPGTGKSWLAKRLGFALIGSKDAEKVFAVQFHPSLAYEDFVRGFRPKGNGRLEVADGVFLHAVNEAQESPESQFVVVIEEINRGNPAQIFGELLTLLETDKRTEEEQIELPYADAHGDRSIYLPENLHVVGTMNLADRSLAMVDFALRRRFAFATLKPQLGSRWRQWVVSELGVDKNLAQDIAHRIERLNEEIEADPDLGPNFSVGHSFVTPPEPLVTGTTRAWFQEVVETEIGPLLEEYWFDHPSKAKQAAGELLEGWH